MALPGKQGCRVARPPGLAASVDPHLRQPAAIVGRCRRRRRLCSVRWARQQQAGVRIVSVGDSRIYRLRQGEFQQLTVDHTLGRRLIATGEMTEQQVGCASSLYQDVDSTLCASESGSGFDIHHCVSDLRDGDTWLCCTDGISQALPDSALAVLLAEASVPGAKVRAILDAARSTRDSDDNLSAIVVDVRAQFHGA